MTRVGLALIAVCFGASVASAQSEAVPDSGPRVVISIAARRLWVLNSSADTMFTAPVAVGSGKSVIWRGKRWTFQTPRGERRVRSKEKDPVWIPPLWHYVEEARRGKVSLVELQRGVDIRVSGGRTLTVRRDSVGIVDADSAFHALPVEDHIVLDGTLYVPPFGTVNRSVRGVLGAYRLNLGGGFGLHGTPEHESIPKPVTHGCVRLHDDDIAWLYRHIPVGARVTVF